MKPTVVTGTAAKKNLTTKDTVLFVGIAPHVVRRVVTPGAPTAVKATAGKQQAKVTWKKPVVTNGALTGYVVTPYIGTTAQRSKTFPATATKGVMTGLKTGTSYSFRVVAKNKYGSSPRSIASNAVTPT
jgi:hypothetical protein